MNQLYEQALRSIISPFKFTHHLSSLCPKQQTIEGRTLQRIDFSFKNEENKTISAMILKQLDTNPEHTILYLHGNGGSKLECVGFVPLICKNNVAVVGFDFIGCGNSDHGFLTYGLNQSKDAENVIKQARKHMTINKLTIWGRSMGAATAIMLAQKKPFPIESLILDSPFHNLLDVIQRVMKTQTGVPKGLCFLASYWLSHQIKKKLNMQIFNIDYLQTYKKISRLVPTLFFYSQSDDIVLKQQVFIFYNACKTHKQLVQIFEEHEQERSLSVFDEGIQWLKSVPSRRGNKIKLSYFSDLLEIQSQGVRSGRGLCCCTNVG